MIKISLIGDIFPGELSYTINYGIRTQFLRHKGKPWVPGIKKIIGESDLVIGNLESPLIEKENKLKDTFYGDPSFTLFFNQCGINVLTIANNHIMEQGDKGFDKTIQCIKDAGLGVVGIVENHRSKILYKEIRGTCIAIAGFSDVDLHKIENNNRFAVLSKENVLYTLDEMKQHNADIKILCLHWGDEYVHIPSPEQREMAYLFIDAGADIIAGHHPHVIQPYAKYKNGHIFYSLGNFMFDYLHSKMVRSGMVAHITIHEDKSLDIELRGVQLSYRKLVQLYDEDEFKQYYSKIENSYSNFSQRLNNDYADRYSANHTKTHLLVRIKMKAHLVREFFLINWRDKRFFLRNLIHHYYNL